MILVAPTGFFGVLCGVIGFWFLFTLWGHGGRVMKDLKRLEQDYKNNPDKIFDLKDYPSLTYKDLVEHFGKDEVNLIKG